MACISGAERTLPSPPPIRADGWQDLPIQHTSTSFTVLLVSKMACKLSSKTHLEASVSMLEGAARLCEPPIKNKLKRMARECWKKERFTVETDGGVGQSEGVAADALVGHEVDALQRWETQLHRHLVEAGLALLLAVFATCHKSHVFQVDSEQVNWRSSGISQFISSWDRRYFRNLTFSHEGERDDDICASGYAEEAG